MSHSTLARFSIDQLENQRWLVRLAPLLLLLLLFKLALGSIEATSPTYDEHEYLARGYLHVKTADSRLKLRHPILLDGLAALPLLLVPEIQLPLDHPSLAAGDFHRYAAVFMWEQNAALATLLFFLGRLPTQWLLLLLAAGVFRWAKTRFGFGAGLLALGLFVLDPNLLAHGRLITPDVGQTAFIFLALFAWWQYWQQPTRARLLLSGVLLGLAQTAGYPALTLYPTFFAFIVARSWRQGRSLPGLKTAVFKFLLAVGLSALSIWAVYRFTWGFVVPWDLTLPAPYYWEEMIDLFARLDRQDLAYLFGEVYRGGRFSFFIVALFVKTPLPTLLLMGIGIVLLLRRRSFATDLPLWLFPLGYYGNALIGSLNIGYRHILPILPFLLVLAGASVSRVQEQSRQLARVGERMIVRRISLRWLVLPLLLWLLLTTWRVGPHYLAYFNELAGGPDGGRNYLVVSDLDWGQDLGGLGRYLMSQAVENVYLSYFGTAPPKLFGIEHQQLPSWPPRGSRTEYPFHPAYPLPGTYAISAANLVGARFEGAPDTFAWFQAKQPVANIGHSILLYEVPRLLDETAVSVDLALGGVALADVPTSLFTEQWQTNDLRLRWFQPSSALLLPAGERSQLIVERQALHPILQERLPWSTAEAIELASGQVASRLDVAALSEQTAVSLPTFAPTEPPEPLLANPTWDSLLTLRGTEVVTSENEPVLHLLTHWQAERSTERPLAIFVHLLALDGSILAQHDGLDVVPESWQAQDAFIQLHPLPLPTPVPEGIQWVRIGVYRTDTFERLPIVAAEKQIGDHILIAIEAVP